MRFEDAAPTTPDRLPPHSDEAEAAVIGCALIAPDDCLPKIIATLKGKSAFYDLRHQLIYSILAVMHRERAAIDTITVQERLRDAGLLEQIGGLAYLAQIQDVPSAANLPAWLDVVREKSEQRRILEVCTDTSAKITAGTVTNSDLRASVQSAFADLFGTTGDLPVSQCLGDLKRRSADDSNELLRTGYLCRAGGLLIAAPTGIGKSSFAIQAQIMFALGRPMFGIHPTRPLRSLYLQAENDEGDLAEMRDGVIAGLSLSPADLGTVFSNITTAHENARTGIAFFCEVVTPLLEKHRPDLLWIDPALSYIGGEANSQRDVGLFLRNQLNPLLSKFNCGCVVIHHTNKPSKGEEKSAWHAGDFAYLGSGSAEWANWARAVLAIRSMGSNNIFELRAGKRGARLGWKDIDGATSFAQLIGHATEPGVICWRTATEDETPAGKPGRAGTREDLTALVPLEKPIAKSLLIDKWKDFYGNHAKGRAFLDQLLADGKLFEWRQNRSGTNAAKLIARKQQPTE